MNRNAFLTKQIGEVFHLVLVRKAPSCNGQQAFPAVFIDDIEDAKGLAMMGAGLHEIVTPDMIGGWLEDEWV